MQISKMKRRQFMPLLSTGLLLAGGASSGADLKDNRPNILLIITDQQFAEVMSCRMGSQYINTPAMDQLARQGKTFTRAYSSNPLCMPYRTSLMTGRYPHETGVTQNKSKVKIDAAQVGCMGNYFRQAGYEAAYSGKWHVEFSQKDSGFESMKAGKAPGGYDETVANGAISFLGRPHDKPFLLVSSFMNPHNICEFARRVSGRRQGLNCGEIGEPPALNQLPPAPANLAPQLNEPDSITLMRQAFQVEDGKFPVGKFTPDDWRKLRWGYYRMAELVDAQISRVLKALRDSGQADNTLIILTSDHGECAGAHGWNQKTVFYEESARVPLIIVAPGVSGGGTAEQLVNTGIDLLPTMMDFAGISIPKKLPGCSLVPLVSGTPVDSWRKYLVVENNLNQASPLNGLTPQMEGRMVRSEKFKYCVYARGIQRESLVDMEADPLEKVNLATDAKYRDVLLSHREMLKEFGREHKDPLVDQLLADDVKPIPFTADDNPTTPTEE